MARSRTGEQCANSLNGLAASANNATDVSSSELHLKDRRSAAWNFRQNHVVRKFDQLANDELEELSHAPVRLTTNPPSHNNYGATRRHWNSRLFEVPVTSVCANISWRLQSEASEVMTVPGPIAALLALLWLPVPRSLLLSYSS
jgi:hypothetical protein